MMRSWKRWQAVVGAALACVAVAAPTQAGAAQGAATKKFPFPDTSLGGTGAVDLAPLLSTPALAGREIIYAPTPSGSVWLGTRSNCGYVESFGCPTSTYLSRLNSKGELATWLGEGGSLGYAGRTPAGSAIAVDGEGRAITVTPEVGAKLTVRRFLASGAPDSDFGGGTGVVTVNCGCQPGSPQEISISTDRDGGILVRAGTWLGGASSGSVTVVRLNADGTPVVGFGADGVLQRTRATENAILSGGGEVFLVSNAGSLAPGTSIERFSPKGVLDKSYGTQTTRSFAQASKRISLAQRKVAALRFRAHGVIDVIFEESIEGAAVVRLRADGSLETKFGSGGVKKLGKLVFQILPGGNGTTLALAASRSWPSGLQLARFLSDYRLDPSFGQSGALGLELGLESGISMAPASNGRVTIVDEGRRFCRSVCLEGPSPKLLRYRVGKAK